MLQNYFRDIEPFSLNKEEKYSFFIKEINLLSTKVFVYTCNNPDEIATLWDAGLSGVITDDPLKFI